MKNINEIKSMTIVSRDIDGGAGYIKIPHIKKDGTKTVKKASVIYSVGGGWEHVSVALLNGNTPTWDDMCFIKDEFWTDDDVVMQLHPRRADYVNVKDNCLHLWRPLNADIPTPPRIFV